MAQSSSQLRCAFVLVAALTLSSVGCYTTTHQQLKPNSSLNDVTGIFTRAGEEIVFAAPGATIEHDTLFATGTVGAFKIPIDSVGSLTRHGFSPWGSLVMLGVAAAAAFAAFAIALSTANWGS